MLKEAEEVSKDEEAPATPASAGPRKKAKTKIGNKYKKKKGKKSTGKGGKDDEEGYEVCSQLILFYYIQHFS